MEFVKKNKGLLAVIAIFVAVVILAAITPESWTITKPIVGWILLAFAFIVVAGVILLYFMTRQ